MAGARIAFKVILRAVLIFGAAFELFGCAVPAAVTVASIAADGASLAATGKTVGDHALSAISGKDCSTVDLVENGVLCHAYPEEAVARVVDEPPPFALPPSPSPLPVVDNSAATFLALGSFPDWDTADKAVVFARDYVPLIVPLDGEQGPAFWVVAGHPLAGGDNAVPVANAKKLGFADAKIMTLCRATYRPGPCVTEEPDIAAVVDSKIRAAQRPATSIAQRIEPAPTDAPTRLY
jgi:hypothetical protein